MKHICSNCGKHYEIRDDFIKPGGMKLRCRQCKNIMIIEPPDKGASAPPPSVPEPPRTVPPAPRQAAVSIPPDTSSEPSDDLPVTARSGDLDLVDDFDLAPPSSTPAEGLPSPDQEAQLPGVREPGADLPASKSGGIADLDDAFELVGSDEQAPDGGEGDLPTPSRGGGEPAGDLDFELDLPSPKPAESAPSARAKDPDEEIAPRSRAGGPAKKQAETIAGMPSPLTTPIPEGREQEAEGSPKPPPKKGATVAGMPAVTPPSETPKPAIGELEDPFGALDLPTPTTDDGPGDDFDVAGGGEEEPGAEGADLPAPAVPSPRPPVPKEQPGSGEFDLDLGAEPSEPDDAQEHRGQPTPLPPVLTSAKQQAPPSRDEGIDDAFGDIDLPAKTPAEEAGGAAPGQAQEDDPFADLDLPSPRTEVKPRDEAPPASDPFADISPPPSDAQEPSPPVPRDNRDDEDAAGRDIFAEITDELGKTPSGEAPAAGAGREAESAPPSSPQSGEAGGVSFGEIDLEGSDDEALGDLVEGEADLPERKYSSAPPGDESMSLELDSLPSGEASRTSMPGAAAPSAPAEQEAPARKSPLRLALMLVLVVVVGGGAAALYFTGAYMEVYKLGSKLLGRDIDAINAQREALLGEVEQDLAADTYAAYSEGAERVAKHVRAHGDDVARGYYVYLAYSVLMRFGDIEQWEKKAAAHLRELKLGKELELEKELAVNAQKLLHGKDATAAYQRLETLARSSPRDPDIAALMGLGALTMGDGEKALSAYERLEGIESASGRVLFGKVRALRMLGRTDEAGELLSELVTNHPRHLDGQILKAKLLISTAQLKQAEVLLGGVTKVGEERLSTRQRSTVKALQGRIHLKQQDTATALELFEEAESMDPNNVEAIVGLATIHLLNQEPAKALGRFKMAASISPTSLDARFGVIESQIDLADFAAAKEGIEELMASHPEDYRVHHLRGRLSASLESFDDAVAAYEKAIEINPAHLPSYLELASLYFESEQISKAMALLEEAKSRLPPTANLHAAFGQGYIERGDLEGALEELESALDVDPQHVQAHFLQGVARYKMGDYERAKEMLDWVERHAPKHPGLVLQQGLLFEALGNLEKAEEYYSQALEEQPDDPEIQIRTASILVSAGKYDEARDILERVLERSPSNPEAMYYLGRVELGEGQPMTALKLFKKAIRIKPNIPVYHLHAAVAEEASASYSDALESVERAIELDEGLAEAYLVRGRLFVRMGAVKDGTRDLLLALELKPELEEAYAPLGKAAELLRKWKEAMEYYRKALEVDPDRGDIHTDLALILYERGGRAKALEHFERAVELGRDLDSKPKWYFTSLFYKARHLEQTGHEDAALEIYKSYLAQAPIEAIDREEVEKRVERLERGF
jgi:tetratricopeptide (TPR) repeat protein